MSKPGVMIYFDVMEPLQLLSDSERGQLLTAILEYGKSGLAPAFEGALAVAWGFIRPRLDADDEKYARSILQKQHAVYCRKTKGEKITFEEWLMLSDNEREQLLSSVIGRTPTTTTSTTTTPTTVTSTTPSPATSTSVKGKADKPTVRKPYGQYGWVRLTDEEYARLQAELGNEELSRCIRYIDESAQANGNKNKWKDWNLVIRKCHRDGWGKQAARPTGGRKGSGDRLLDMINSGVFDE